MKPDPLNGFLDFNKDGKIDASEDFMGFMMFKEIFRDEDDDFDTDEDDD